MTDTAVQKEPLKPAQVSAPEVGKLAGASTPGNAGAGAPGAPVGAPGAGDAPPDEGVVPKLSFWRQPWVQDVLPFATSLAIHLGLIVLGFATYKAAQQIARVVKEQIIIPDSGVVASADVGGIPNPGMGPDADRAAQQDADPTVTESKGLSEQKSNLNATLMSSAGGGEGEDSGGDLIGNGPSTGKGGGKGGGVGTGFGAGGAGGDLAVFGQPGGGGGIGPKGKVFGHGGNAMRIVYVCDASGSMLPKMDLLKAELARSIDQLIPIQGFDVLFFQDSANNPKHYVDLAPDLIMANADNKKKLSDFLQDIVPTSSTHVIPALTQAFRLPNKPQLLYLLTDGAFEDEGGPAVIEAIARLNGDHMVKVNTVLLIGKDLNVEEEKSSTEVMKKIADENGGVFNKVSVDDL